MFLRPAFASTGEINILFKRQRNVRPSFMKGGGGEREKERQKQRETEIKIIRRGRAGKILRS